MQYFYVYTLRYCSIQLNPTRVQLLVIHSLVSTLPSRPISTQLSASIKKGLSARLHISFNDSLWESPLFSTLYLLVSIHLWHKYNRLHVQWKFLLILNSETVIFCEKVFNPLRGDSVYPIVIIYHLYCFLLKYNPCTPISSQITDNILRISSRVELNHLSKFLS